jgi:hypothetical protein
MGAQIPDGDLQLAEYAENGVAVITPAAPTFGLSSAQLTSLTAAATDYRTKLTTAREPSTRTSVSVALKNTSKNSLKALLRALYRIVDAYPLTTDGQRAALGITIPDRHPTPINAPTTQPVARIAGTGGGFAEVELRDQLTPDSPKKPAGASGAQVYYVLTAPNAPEPDFATDGVFYGVASKGTYRLTLPSDSAGQRLWIQARWMTRRGLTGPTGVPTSAVIAA